jgi:hypothetical protein
MYTCQICGAPSESGKSAQRVTLETRVRKYPKREDVHLVPTHKKKKPRKKENEFIDDPGGIGFEIAREALVCSRCAAERRGQ